MKKKTLIVFSFVVVLLFAFACSSSSENTNTPGKIKHPKVKAIDFTLSDTSGNSINLKKSYEKHPVLMYFWATWCPHCRHAPSELKKLSEHYGVNKLEIIGINVAAGDSFKKVKRYKEKNKINFPLLYDKNGIVTRKYNVRGIPLFVLINTDGYIVYFSHEVPEKIEDYLSKG